MFLLKCWLQPAKITTSFVVIMSVCRMWQIYIRYLLSYYKKEALTESWGSQVQVGKNPVLTKIVYFNRCLVGWVTKDKAIGFLAQFLNAFS